MNAADETNITDIDVLPDGRICVFGTSIEVLEVLDQMQCGTDRSVSERLEILSRNINDCTQAEPAVPEDCDV
jgi:hypothetical protein